MGVLAALEFHLLGWLRTWRANIFTPFVIPVLTMLSFGVGVGQFIEGGVDGVPYLDWIVPGMVASTALQSAMAESTWPVLSRFEWIKVYHSQIATPLRVRDVLGGQVAFMLVRVLMTTTVFLVVAAVFGTLHSPWALATVPVALLVAAAAALPTIAFSASITSEHPLILLYQFAIIPMTLFAGVFFPVDLLPEVLRWVAYVFPLWHGVDLCRAAALGVAPDWSALGHVLVLAAWVVVGWPLAYRRFRDRLVK